MIELLFYKPASCGSVKHKTYAFSTVVGPLQPSWTIKTLEILQQINYKY